MSNSNNNIEDSSREIWREMRDGTSFEQLLPDKEDYKEDFYGLISTEGINYQNLVKFIKDFEQDHTLIFNWDNFDIPATHYQERNPDRFGPRTREVIKGNNIPFSYKNADNKIITTTISGLLNKRKDYLEDKWGIRFKIDAKGEIILASLFYYYENTYKLREDAKDTLNTNDYRIEKKYVAISLTANNFIDFSFLIKEIEGETAYKNIQNQIATYYTTKIHETKTPEELDFLYENAPDFVLKNIDDDTLFEDLKTLLKWDKEKWFTDTSNAMLNILKGFKKPKELYAILENDPNFVLQLYSEMDKGNLRNFGEIMTVLGILFCTKERDKRSIQIPLGTKYKLDSDLFFDEDAKTINLKILEEVTVQNTSNSTDYIIGGLAPAITPATSIELNVIGNYPNLHPLDMVTIINEDGSQQTVAAIYVKFLSDTAEKELIKETIIIIAEVVSILVSAGVLAAGAGVFWSTMAVADILLNTTDLALKDDEIRSELSKYEAGKWFVDNWDTIYGVSGFVMLGAATARGILVEGPKLLAKITTQQAQLKNFVNSAISSAVLQIEIANFTKNTFKYIPWEEIRTIKNIDNYGISSIISSKMAKANVLMAISNDAQTMALIYKGEVIAVGNGKSIKETLKNLFTFARKEKDIAAHLDELFDTTVFVKKIAHLLKTKVDEAFFWSGRTDGIGGKMIAYEIAISKKGITLEGLIDRTKIMEQMPLWDLKNPKSIKIWQKTSQYFASLSSGKVRVILGTFVDEKSVWLNYELPALKSNIKVREIISIDPKTKVEKLIFKR